MSETADRFNVLFDPSGLQQYGASGLMTTDTMASTVFAIHEQFAEAGKTEYFTVAESEIFIKSAEDEVKALRNTLTGSSSPQVR
jgi:hypothetical protein